MNDKTQPEALQLADEANKLSPILHGMLEGGGTDGETDIYADDYSAPDGDVYVYRAGDLIAAMAAELCRQHARIAELEAQIEAAGAGGVQPLSLQIPAVDLANQAQAAINSGAHAGEPTQEMISAVLALIDLDSSDPEDHRYDDGSKLAEAICRAVLAASPTPPAEQPAQPGAVYAELPAPTASIGLDDAWHEPAMRDFADRTHALRIAAAPQAAPAQDEIERLREKVARMGLDVDRALRGEVNAESPLGATRLQAVAALAAPETGNQQFNAGREFEAARIAAMKAPQAAPAVDEAYCGLQAAADVLRWIAKRERQVGDVLEPVNDIRVASRLSSEGYRRISLAIKALDAAMAAPQAAPAQDERAAFEAFLKAKPEVRYWNTTDAMLCAFNAGRHAPLTQEQKSALLQARSTAMQMAASARIPECGDFAGIAQNLDWLCGSLGVAAQGGA